MVTMPKPTPPPPVRRARGKGHDGHRPLAAGPGDQARPAVGRLGPYGIADGPDATTSLGAAVLEAYGDQLAATDRAAADAAYQDAAAEQRSFAAAATSGGEGLARMAEAGRIDAKRHR